jgi:hypothetical protein
MRLPIPQRLRTAAVVCGLLVVAAPALVRAEDDDFVPPAGSLPAQRTGGASRTQTKEKDVPHVSLLAPADTLGLTTRAQPVIYWYLSDDSARTIAIAINDPRNLEKQVVETKVAGPLRRGVHKLDLSQLKQDGKPVKLDPGVKYDVAIEVVVDASAASANPSATCRLQRVDPKNLPADVDKEADPAKRAAAYGKAGIWFDYLDAINAAIEANPKDDALLQKRAKALAAQRLEWKSNGTIAEKRKQEAAAGSGGGPAKP